MTDRENLMEKSQPRSAHRGRAGILHLNFTRYALLALGVLLLAGTCSAGFSCNEKGGNETNCCFNLYNLQHENKEQLYGPVVVDINESTGNMLVRGPLPLTVRTNKGQSGGCLNFSDWSFAYAEFNATMPLKNPNPPGYFTTDGKQKAFRAAMQDFNLDDYEIVDISLLDHKDYNTIEFGALARDFGGITTNCNATPAETTLHGHTASLVSSTFVFCPTQGPDDTCRNAINNDDAVAGTCSFSGRIDQIIALMAQERGPSDKKLLIYYHCVLGSDRTGSVTIGYLQKTRPDMSFAHAMKYALYQGRESSNGGPTSNVNIGANLSAQLYCASIGADCSMKEAPRIFLPGSDTHSHLPGQEDAIATPVPTAVPVVVQTPVDIGRYNPSKNSGANF